MLAPLNPRPGVFDGMWLVPHIGDPPFLELLFSPSLRSVTSQLGGIRAQDLGTGRRRRFPRQAGLSSPGGVGSLSLLGH